MRHLSRASWVRRSLVVSLPLLVAASVVGGEGLARADEPGAQDIAQARELGGQAQAAFQAGNFAESEKLWSAASRLYPLAPTLTLGLARTQAKLGKFVAAQESYNKIIREWSDKPNAQPAFKDALEAAKAEVGAVSAKLANVVITLDGNVPNAQVTLDGTPVNTAALGLKRPVDPGTHVVKATAEGYKPAEASFQVQEGGSGEAKLKLEKDPNAVAAAPAGPATGPTTTPAGDPGTSVAAGTDKGGSSNKTLAIVAFGVGGAGLVLGTITGLVAVGKHSDLQKACPDGKCPADQKSAYDSYKTMGTLSTVGFVVAGVGAAAGAVLLLTSPKQTTGAAGSGRYATTKTSPRVVPYLGLGGGGVTGEF